MFLVSGITGHVGGAAARWLLDEGHAVRAMVRDPAKASEWARRGVELRQGDFADATAVAAALDGVAGAFLMMPPYFAPEPGFPEARAVTESFRAALRQAPPPRLVVLSSIGSHQPGALGLITATRVLEEGLRDLPFPTAFVRPGSFLENYVQDFDAAAATGEFQTLFQPADRPYPMVATDDIGRQVARLLVDGWQGTQVVELGSPVSPDDLARGMGAALGRPVRARAVPRGEWEQTLAARGLPPGFIRPYTEMWDGANAGWIAFGVPGTRSVPATLTPADFFARVRQARDGDATIRAHPGAAS